MMFYFSVTIWDKNRLVEGFDDLRIEMDKELIITANDFFMMMIYLFVLTKRKVYLCGLSKDSY